MPSDPEFMLAQQDINALIRRCEYLRERIERLEGRQEMFLRNFDGVVEALRLIANRIVK